MTNITREEFTAALERAVAERGGDYIYPEDDPAYHDGGVGACVYALEDGTPACIIGQALFYIHPDLVPDHDLVANALDVLLPITEDARVAQAAEVAQVTQDAGHPWGDALEAYKSALEG